jgi:hypothetical protein
VRTFLRDNGLGLAFGGMFLAALVAQSFAGMAQFNQQQLADSLATVDYLQYVTSSDFAVDVAENWQSEYLQFLLYIWATVWLIQRGSPESKEPDQIGKESDRDQQVGAYADARSPWPVRRGGLAGAVYARSLALVMGAIFVASWLAQSLAGAASYSQQQLAQREDPVSWTAYILTSDFWNRTLQNWQSELLAIGSMAVLSVYLRQRGSPESKPVGAAHDSTAVSG